MKWLPVVVAFSGIGLLILAFALADKADKATAARETDGAVIVSEPLPPPVYKPTAQVIGKYAGQVDLWQRNEGSYYLFIKVDGWEPIYLDATGPVINKIKVK